MNFKTIVFIAAFIFLFSCDNSVNKLPGSNDVTGTISISFPSTSRGWVNSDVSGVVNQYEILVYNAVNTYTSGEITDIDTAVELTIPIGTYDILAIAGSNGHVFGLGEAQSISVIDNEYSTVSIELNTFSWELIPSSTTVNPSASFNVDITAVLPVSSLGLRDSGGSLGIVFNGDIIYYAFTKSLVEDNTFNATVTLTSPALEGDYDLWSNTNLGDLRLVDDDYSIDTMIYSISSVSWYIADYSSSNPDVVKSSLRKTITVSRDVSSEGLSISFGWGAD